MDISSIINHLGEERKKYFNAVSPPILQTSNFCFDSVSDLRHAVSDELINPIYSRGNNPTVEILRKKLAALEGSEDCLVFSSGSAAIAAALIGNVNTGDHIICVENPYSWTKFMLDQFLPRFGVHHTYVDARELKNIEDAIKPNTKVLMLESPNTMTFELQDLPACAALAKKHNILTICDNSYSSPIFQRPIEMGIDMVVHSGTKYLNGHSDVVVGVLCGPRKMIKQLFHSEFMGIGANLQAHDAALVIRGLRTLPIRMSKSYESGMKVAQFLEDHSKIKQVNYPFLKSAEQYDLAKKQMSGCSGMFTFELNVDSIEQAEKFSNGLKRFLIAVSWGGYESLIVPLAAFYDVEGKDDPVYPFTMVRMYIGLEDVDLLIADIEQALDQLD